MIAILWRFRVKPEHAEEYERVYGPDGDWAQLFRRAEGYLGTELLRGSDGDYLTIDHWRDISDFAAFKKRYGDEYAALDAHTEAWTEEETNLGTWGVPE